jgi:hypothetical protein
MSSHLGHCYLKQKQSIGEDFVEVGRKQAVEETPQEILVHLVGNSIVDEETG